MPAFSFKKICPWCVQHEAAQRGEDSDQQIVQPAPWVRRKSSISLTKVLFGANIAVFIAMVAASGSIDAFPDRILDIFGANWGPHVLVRNDWWRLLTYMFVHIDIWHIAFNMWCLWSLGALCESLYGTWTFGAIYLICGISGGLARLAWNPMVPSVGASGAIFGLAGALIASLYLGEFNLPSYVIQANLKSLLFFAGFNILFGISAIGDMFGVHVDNACHIGGLVSGLLLGALIALVAPQRDDPGRRVGVLLVVALIVGGSAVGVERWRGAQLPQREAIRAQLNAESAINDLQKKIRANPQDMASHMALARAYMSSGQLPEAETELKQVNQLQPQNTQAWLQLGAIYLHEGRGADAQAAFTKLTANDPNSISGHAGLGEALADQDNHAAAIEEFKTALRLDPQLTGVNYYLGVSQAKLQHYDDAIAAFRKELEIGGDDPTLELALADAYQAKGMTKEAQAARDRADKLRSGETD